MTEINSNAKEIEIVGDIKDLQLEQLTLRNRKAKFIFNFKFLPVDKTAQQGPASAATLLMPISDREI